MTDVYGYIRFSFLGRSDAKTSRHVTDEQERIEQLFAPQRMEERFYLFENITLPSLRAQRDQDYHVVVLASPAMPDPYKARLAAAVAGIPQIELLYSDARHVNHAITDWMRERLSDTTHKTAHFRLDDDDAISADMVTVLREAIGRARRDELLTFPRGFYLAYDDSRPYLVRKFEENIAIAWSFVNEPGQIRSPYDGHHVGHYNKVPSMVDPTHYAYIHVAHNASDTHMNQRRKLNRALRFDPRNQSERAQARIEQIVASKFPAFTAEGLKQIIARAPGHRSVEHGSLEPTKAPPS